MEQEPSFSRQGRFHPCAGLRNCTPAHRHVRRSHPLNSHSVNRPMKIGDFRICVRSETPVLHRKSPPVRKFVLFPVGTTGNCSEWPPQQPFVHKHGVSHAKRAGWQIGEIQIDYPKPIHVCFNDSKVALALLHVAVRSFDYAPGKKNRSAWGCDKQSH